MSIRTTPWPAGTPCWVDVSAGDEQATRDFYGALFGWQFDIQPEQFHYALATVDGHPVAGVGGKQDPSQPSAWLTYLATDDASATATAVTAAGGAVVAGPMEIPGSGHMLVALDPAGAAVGAWQGTGMSGAQLVNQAGGIVWNQQVSRDLERSAAFYADAFGLRAEVMDGAPDLPFRTLHLDGPPVGGIAAMDESSPADLPAHWLTYFAVLDTDATVDRVQQLGGRVVEAASDTPYGRQAVLAGPEGEVFAVMSVPAEGQQRPPDA